MSNHHLWTPWRMEYIAGADDDNTARQDRLESAAQQADLPHIASMESTGCVFCDRVSMSPEHDRSNLILLRAERNFIILNLYPYNSAHLMVVPNLHTADFASLDSQTVNEMTALVQKMLGVVGAEYHPQGYNLGMNMGRIAGAGVADHVHMHLVPRWAGDTNFMPVVGATKVMPELLETTYDRLKKHL